MNRVFIFLLSLTLITPSLAQAQGNETQSHIVIHRDAKLDTLVQRLYDANLTEQKIPGYRVQIYSGSNRSLANQVKSLFMTSYPGVKVYLSYSQPYFKLRIGDFRTKAESMKMYNILLTDEHFKAVLIVPDMIFLPELKTDSHVEKQD
jgi:hypothetical protein